MKMFSSKKALTVLSLAAVITLLTAALSAAWWVKNGLGTGGYPVKMGRMDIAATLEGDASWLITYEPGQTVYNGSAAITNSGSVDAFLKLDFSIETMIYSDEEGDPLDAGDEYLDTSNVVSLGILSGDQCEIGQTGMGYSFDNNLAWYTDGTDYYLFLPAGVETELVESLLLELDGPGMGNEYMDAVITVSLSWESTQMNKDAILAGFGVDFDDLTMIDFDLDA